MAQTNGSMYGSPQFGFNPMMANPMMMGMNPMMTGWGFPPMNPMMSGFGGNPQQMFAAQQAANAYQQAMMVYSQVSRGPKLEIRRDDWGRCWCSRRRPRLFESYGDGREHVRS